MKTVKDKQILVGADIAGVPLKNAVVEHLSLIHIFRSADFVSVRRSLR